MAGFNDIFKSERGVFTLLVLIMVTILTAIGKVTADQWIEFTKWLTVAFISGKTISHAVETMKPATSPTSAATPPPSPLPTATALPKDPA
jgi:hypothetical protein